jgi:hypothetical protein
VGQNPPQRMLRGWGRRHPRRPLRTVPLCVHLLPSLLSPGPLVFAVALSSPLWTRCPRRCGRVVLVVVDALSAMRRTRRPRPRGHVVLVLVVVRAS